VEIEQSQKYRLLFRAPIVSDWAFRLYLLSILGLFLFLQNQQVDVSQVSPGQAAFDLIATTVDQDSMFDIDITDPAQREYMFASGEGFVGGVGKNASGILDGLLRCIEIYVLFFPFLVWRRIRAGQVNNFER
jgi:hypothetical protein